MKNLKKINPILVAILAYSIRILYFGANYADAPVLAILAGLYFGLMYLETKKIVITENKFRIEVGNDISAMKTAISTLSMTKNSNPFKGR